MNDEEYTPTDDEARFFYRSVRVKQGVDDDDAGAEFDRMIEWVKGRSRALGYMIAQDEMQNSIDGAVREMQAKVWDECAQSAGDMASPLMDQNPYRDDPLDLDWDEELRKMDTEESD